MKGKVKVTEEEKEVLRNIHHNEGRGTQFTALAVKLGLANIELSRVLASLEDKGIIVRRNRENRVFVNIREEFRK